MPLKIRLSIASFRKQKRAASLMGYALMVGLISVIALGSISRLGVSVNQLFGGISSDMRGVTGEITFNEITNFTAGNTITLSGFVVSGSSVEISGDATGTATVSGESWSFITPNINTIGSLTFTATATLPDNSTANASRSVSTTTPNLLYIANSDLGNGNCQSAANACTAATLDANPFRDTVTGFIVVENANISVPLIFNSAQSLTSDAACPSGRCTLTASSGSIDMVKINSGGTVISNLNLTHAAGATRNIFLPIAGFTASDMLLDGGSGALAVTDLAETAAISLTNIDISNAITAIGTNITTEYLTKSLDFTLNNVTMNITNHCYIYNNKAIIQSNSFLMQNSTCFSSSANAFNISMTGTNASIPMDITLNNSSILNAGADGIAMVLEDAPVNLIIENSTITNASSRGMDISLRDNVTFSAIIRNNSTISNAALELVRIDNDTVSSGGSVTVDIDDSSFINAGASGIFLNDLSATSGATITIDNTIVTDTNN